MDAQRAALAAAWRECSDWRQPGFPRLAKVVLTAGALTGMLGCHLSVLFKCFVHVTVADRYDEPPIDSDPWNIVRGTSGVLVIVCFALSTTCLVGYRTWLSRRAAAHVALGQSLGRALDATSSALEQSRALAESAMDPSMDE